MITLIYLFYPLFYLSLGNITRFFFVSYLGIFFFQEFFFKRLLITPKVLYPILFLIFFNIILFIINQSSLPKLGFHILQIMLILLFSGCSYKFAKSTSNLLKNWITFYYYIFLFFFILKILGIDITELLIISRINEYLHIISNSSSYERYIFLIGMREKNFFWQSNSNVYLIMDGYIYRGFI